MRHIVSAHAATSQRNPGVILSCLLLLFLPGTSVIAQPTSDHTYTSATIAAGMRVFVRKCALCHGPDGTWVPEIDLGRNRFRTAVTDADLQSVITNGAADGRMPALALDPAEMQGIIAYIRTGFDPEGETVQIGNPEHGKTIFAGPGQCATCHRTEGVGPRAAPDLSDIALLRTPAVLQRTLVDPASALLPINRPVAIVTRDGTSITGRRLNEDTYTVQLVDSTGQLRSLDKTNLKSYEISTTPIHKPSQMAADDVADLLGYLLTLRGE